MSIEDNTSDNINQDANLKYNGLLLYTQYINSLIESRKQKEYKITTNDNKTYQLKQITISPDGSTTEQVISEFNVGKTDITDATGITGIIMNGESKGTDGVIDLGTVLTGDTFIPALRTAYGNCTCEGDVVIKPVTVSQTAYENWKLEPGAIITIKYTNDNTVNNVKLKVNDYNEIPIVVGESWIKNETREWAGKAKYNITYMYTGTNFVAISKSWDNDTTYSNFVKSGSTAAAGLVPAPSTTAGNTKYLREDGTWQEPPQSITDVATTSSNGLMSSADKVKLNGIATGATANIGTITGIKMNGSNKGISGVVDLGTVLTSHQDVNSWTKSSNLLGASSNITKYFDKSKCSVYLYYNDVLKKVVVDVNFTTTSSSITGGASATFASINSAYRPSVSIRKYIITDSYTICVYKGNANDNIAVNIVTGTVAANTSLSARLEWQIV